jgi:hypothetical protein
MGEEQSGCCGLRATLHASRATVAAACRRAVERLGTRAQLDEAGPELIVALLPPRLIRRRQSPLLAQIRVREVVLGTVDVAATVPVSCVATSRRRSLHVRFLDALEAELRELDPEGAIVQRL